MADKRMFTKKITESDAFLDMPGSTQALYFHLNMAADDDGFVNNPKKIVRMVGSSEDDLKLLIIKKFLIVFESGVIVIKHWRMHNYIQNDRYHPTVYTEEKSQLGEKENKSYTLLQDMDTKCIQDVSKMDTEIRLDKIRLDIDKNNISETESKKTVKHKYGEYKNVMLTDDELKKLKDKFPSSWESKIKNMDEAIALKGYKYKSHYLAILKWAEKDKPEKPVNPFAEYKGVTI